jgi:WD40 repeat protein
VWDAESGSARRTLEGFGKDITALTGFHGHDGHRIIAGDDGGRLAAFDPLTGDCLLALGGVEPSSPRPPSGVTSPVASPRLELSARDFVAEGHSRGILSLLCVEGSKLDPPRVLVVSGAGDHRAIVWAPEEGRVVSVLEGHDGPVTSLATYEGREGRVMLCTGGWRECLIHVVTSVIPSKMIKSSLIVLSCPSCVLRETKLFRPFRQPRPHDPCAGPGERDHYECAGRSYRERQPPGRIQGGRRLDPSRQRGEENDDDDGVSAQARAHGHAHAHAYAYAADVVTKGLSSRARSETPHRLQAYDGTLIVWDPVGGQRIHSLPGHAGWIECLQVRCCCSRCGVSQIPVMVTVPALGSTISQLSLFHHTKGLSGTHP